MLWSERYGSEQMPTQAEISSFIGNAMWEEFNAYLQRVYGVEPSCAYSKCPAQKGWNVKYQKSGRSLCTLYPMEGYFIALVAIGAKEQAEANLALKHCTNHVRELYEKTVPMNGSRWLMIRVTGTAVFEDVKRLIAVRRPVK
ncbi:MAG: DUF3788 domain-containing protein [Bacillota bacterium]